MLKIFFFVFYKIAIQFCGNAKQNPGCIAVTAIQNFKSIFSLVLGLVVCHGFQTSSKNLYLVLRTPSRGSTYTRRRLVHE